MKKLLALFAKNSATEQPCVPQLRGVMFSTCGPGRGTGSVGGRKLTVVADWKWPGAGTDDWRLAGDLIDPPRKP